MAAEIIFTHKYAGDCILCMCRPVDEITKRAEPMFHAIGVDVNYGDNANVCVVCAGVMADLLGRPPREEVEKLRDRIAAMVTEKREMADKLHTQQEDIDKIKAGAKAQKKVRAA